MSSAPFPLCRDPEAVPAAEETEGAPRSCPELDAAPLCHPSGQGAAGAGWDLVLAPPAANPQHKPVPAWRARPWQC